MMRMRTMFVLVGLAVLAANVAVRADWHQFRGPHGLGVSDQAGLPAAWSEDENVVWKVELPGAGASCPVILGDRVYVTCYSGYGQDPEDPGDMKDLMRHVVCLDRATGTVLWQRQFPPLLPESKYQGNGAHHGYSSSTPITDGQLLYVFFGKSGVFALDLDDGSTRWQTSVGTGTNGWGSANSPVLYDDLLIINACSEDRALVGLEKQTGKEVWRAKGIKQSWATPMLVDVPGGATEVVVSVEDWVLGFDPKTGAELWRAEGISDYTCPSPTAHDGVVYVTAGRRAMTVAIRAGGRGDVSESHVLWRKTVGVLVPSPVYHDGYLYMVDGRRQTAVCLDAETGESVYRERLSPRPGTIYASPILAEGRLYVVSQHKGTYVLAAEPKFELLAHNTTADDSRANASPSISDGQLLIRSDRYLYCIGK